MLANGLAERKDFDISIIAPFHANEYLKHGKRSLVKGPYFNQNFFGIKQLKNIGRELLLPIHFSLNSHADVIHETYYSIKPTGLGKFRVLTVYDMIHELFSEEFNTDLITTKAKKAAISRADHIICISESTRQDLHRLLEIDKSKTSVVYLGHSLIHSAKQPWLRAPIEKPYLLYVGNRDGYKNFYGFCQAFASSSFLRKELDIIAFGGGMFNNSEQIFLKGLSLEQQTHYISGDDDLLKILYQHATLFVYPSLYEGFGIPPLEAMNFDCPVACSNTSSIPEVVGDAGIYFDPYSIDSMREALEIATTSSDIRAELISNGQLRLKMFSWEKCVSETAKVYTALAK
jgi:glycosyltransferase involved in cell wall biosynthesis